MKHLIDKALQSGTERMTLVEYLEYNRQYSIRLMEDYRNMMAMDPTPTNAKERVRIELASLGIRV